MVTAIVLLKIERTRINEVAEELAAMEGISEVYSVSGEVDVVAMVRVRTNDDLATLITSRLVAVNGILETRTMLAFRTLSRHDLEAMFSIGMEG